MEFLKLRSVGKILKRKDVSVPEPGAIDPVGMEQTKSEDCDAMPKTANDQLGTDDVEDEDDDDFITNEVKRRLKELRKKSFMVLIPEESCPEEEEEEEEEASSSEWRESEAKESYPWHGFDAFYEKYCERMLFFDKMSSQQLQEAGSQNLSNPSPRSSSKLVLTFRNLSFKKKDEFQDDGECLQQEPQTNTQSENLEVAYVAQICLSWEALHCQFMELYQRIASQPEGTTCYSYAAQAFQQFQVLLQRFIENELFEDGTRFEIYLRTRNCLPKLLQVPNFHRLDEKPKEDGSEPVLASDLAKIMGDCIITFHNFLKTDKKRSMGSTLHLFGDHNQRVSSLQQIQNSFDKKEIKIKELFKKKKGWRKKRWPATQEEVLLLFGLIDLKVVSRVLRMAKISKEQLLWCEEKMCKLNVSENGLQRDASPMLFPC